MNDYTNEQAEWLARNPNYQSVGTPRLGVLFVDAGTLYPDGRFEKLEPMKVVRLPIGPPFAICVGVRVHGGT